MKKYYAELKKPMIASFIVARTHADFEDFPDATIEEANFTYIYELQDAADQSRVLKLEMNKNGEIVSVERDRNLVSDDQLQSFKDSFTSEAIRQYLVMRIDLMHSRVVSAILKNPAKTDEIAPTTEDLDCVYLHLHSEEFAYELVEVDGEARYAPIAA